MEEWNDKMLCRHRSQRDGLLSEEVTFVSLTWIELISIDGLLDCWIELI